MNLGGSSVIMVMPEEITNTLSFTDALNVLENISKDSFTVDAWIPSLNRTVKVKELTAKQQKKLIESAIDVTIKKPTFSRFFYEIVSENCLEEKSVIDNFTTADVVSIAFYMRSQISDTIKVVFQETPKIEEKIEIKTILDKISNYSNPSNEIVDFSKNDVSISVELGLPIFYQQHLFDEFLYGNKKEKDQVEEIKTLISSAFLGETSKYIKDIKVNGNSLNYGALSVAQKQQVIGVIPASLIQNILEKIVGWKEKIDEICTVEKDSLKKSIEIDSMLFLTT
jgi:hypothetical protein